MMNYELLFTTLDKPNSSTPELVGFARLIEKPEQLPSKKLQ